ncbi:centaurin-gamma-1A [Chrysoperla carnea]|uniref:centaurin-gamma-1A n=1 Tax=Chrysoperla carnea TaxID=189513 RepID=UPI001D09983A|nr:centaurin-gamma-1A [Chrysoperla carnea]
MPESFLRSIKRRSLRVKRAKSLVLPEKRKSDSFVNSQEWTLSRSVPDLRLGIVGSLSSGKSALVHRYLTGSYMQEESPEGGRFKKEIVVDNQSYLLLIRDEGGPPELQFTAWVDAVIFVFSLENESSFNAIYNYYTKMSHFRNSAEIPLILVGTQDAISENNPRVIDDARARKLATDLKRCSYYETCATYGLNVERVFQDACQKIVQQRLSSSAVCLTPTNSRPSTPNNHFGIGQPQIGASATIGAPQRHPHLPNVGNGGGVTQVGVVAPSPTNGFGSSSTGSPASNTHSSASPSHNAHTLSHKEVLNMSLSGRQVHTLSASSHHLHRHPDKHDPQPRLDDKWSSSSSTLGGSTGHMTNTSSSQAFVIQTIPTENNNVTKYAAPQGSYDNSLQPPQSQSQQKDGKDLPTPSSTPTTSRKSRRRSNLFTPSKKGDDKLKNGELGSGRAIPLKQGYLYKRSSKTLNKEWKKKYVTLCDDGRLTYHPSLHDYMDDIHGKEISLQYVTVKVPGQKPRGSKSIITVANSNGSCINESLGGLSLSSFDSLKDSNSKFLQPSVSGDEGMVVSNSNSFLNGETKMETPNVKKRHRRMKSSGVKNSEYDDSDVFEFYIVSLDSKQWHFEAASCDERDDWVSAIEQQILNSLQGNESSKNKRTNNPLEATSIQAIRARVPGNGFCVDCDASNPDWASLNLGVLMCIECSGVHRNLGSHISKVRSLGLDEWPPGHLSVMLAIGNKLGNSIWESNTNGRIKPTPNSSREEKEQWIRHKYESKEFLAAPASSSVPLGQQLVDAVCRSDMKAIVTILAHATPDQVNTVVSTRDLRTPLHLACAMGNLAVAQLLIWHNGNAKAVDHEGRTCLMYALAAAKAHTAAAGGNGVSSELATATARGLIELLLANGCPDIAAISASGGTLPRRRGSVGRREPGLTSYEKLPSSVI